VRLNPRSGSWGLALGKHILVLGVAQGQGAHAVLGAGHELEAVEPGDDGQVRDRAIGILARGELAGERLELEQRLAGLRRLVKLPLASQLNEAKKWVAGFAACSRKPRRAESGP